MVTETIVIDAVRQARAREYARTRRVLWFLSTALAGAYLLLWMVLPRGGPIREALHGLVPAGSDLPWTVDLGLFATALVGPWCLLSFPIQFYAGYILPHRYGLSTQTLRGWFGDLGKQAALSLALGAPSLLCLYLLMRAQPSVWWIWAGVLYTLLAVALTALTPIVFLPMFYKFVPLGTEHEDLSRRLMILAEAAGTKIRGVYRFDMSRRTRAANAMLIGLGRSRRIVLGDTLLSEFTMDEIETVLAHELAHHVHRDIPLGILLETVFNFLAFFLISLALQWGVDTMGLKAIHDPAGLPILAIASGITGLALMPWFSAYGRWREAKADDYALHATGKPWAFANAMIRLVNQNLAELDPERWVVALFHSHPSPEDRVAAARAFGAVRDARKAIPDEG